MALLLTGRSPSPVGVLDGRTGCETIASEENSGSDSILQASLLSELDYVGEELVWVDMGLLKVGSENHISLRAPIGP